LKSGITDSEGGGLKLKEGGKVRERGSFTRIRARRLHGSSMAWGKGDGPRTHKQAKLVEE